MNNLTMFEYHGRRSHRGNGRAKGWETGVTRREVVENPETKSWGHYQGLRGVTNNNGKIYDGICCS